MEERIGSFLTGRECDVLELMAIGLTNKDIADRLGLSARTVETHIAHVLDKLDAHTRTGAISEARRRGLLAATPASASVHPAERSRHNLPSFTTSLLGREADLTHVRRLLERHHLITLTGAGGVGKTRLAVEAGSKLIDFWQNGVWFCDFSTISDPSSVQRAVAWAVGVPERHQRLLGESIVVSLKPKCALLIFDNCEHVAETVVALADEIVQACPNVSILATSRQRFGISEEAVHRVPSLALPKASSRLTADAAMTSGSVALFVDRACAAQPGFTLTDDNAPAIGKLCRHLDGIPLAIELAAARVNEFSIEALSENVGGIILNFQANGRALLPRHQTMRALLDWSYALLSPKERTLFRRLAVFVGGFTVDLAAAVCRDAIRRSDFLEVLRSLIEKSLVQTTQDREAMRYALAESTRQFGLEKLRAAGEYLTVAHAHAQAMTDFARRLDEAFPTTPDALYYAQARPEFANWCSALRWAFDNDGDALLGAAIAGSIDRLWLSYGREVEGLRWIEDALTALDDRAPIAVRARLEMARAEVNVNWRREEALAQAQRSWKLYESAADDASAAAARSLYASSLFRFGRFAEAEAHMREVLSVARSHNHHRLAGLALNGIAHARFDRGDIAGARANLVEALTEFEAGGHDFGMSVAAVNLAEIAYA
ncbi:MAG TPA: LuxR C-terminal-related transcriptional regulator, partial [Candidatus Cybelea sp.]